MNENEYAEKFAAAMASEGGATPDEGAAVEETVEANSGTTEGETVENGSGQPPAKADPWESIKVKYTPEVIAELERKAEEAENAKAMRREAHLRNETAAKERERAEAALRKADEALSSNRHIAETLRHFANTNPELGIQMLQTLRRADEAERESGGSERVSSIGGEDPRIAKLEAELESLKRQQTEYAYGTNTRVLEELAWEVVGKDDLLSKSSLKELGVPEKVVQQAIASVYERDRTAPEGEKISPYDRRAMRKAIEEAVAAERKSVQKLHDTIIKEYRADKKAKHSGLPPSGTGQTASVRGGAPTSSGPPSNLRGKARDEWLVRQFAEASKSRMRSEV